MWGRETGGRPSPGRFTAALTAAVLGTAALTGGCSGGTGGTASGAGSSPGRDSPAAAYPASPSSQPSHAATPIALGPGDWPTYNRDNARDGAAVGLRQPGPLSVAWRASMDSAVYGQPLVLGGLVVAATENDSVYGLDSATGRVRWRTSLGRPEPLSALPCGDIDPLGITSTMAYDPASGSLFALAEIEGGRHVLAALDPSSGSVLWKREVESPRGNSAATQQRGALIVAFGRVYVPFGGLYGDCGFYVGSVVAVPVSGSGPQQSYSVPTPQKGGIWTPGGLAQSGNALLVSVGNGEVRGGAFDGSDSVLALTPDLARGDFFAPATWGSDNAADLDLGAMSPALVGDSVLIVGKSGTAYLLRSGHLGGVGGEVAQKKECAAYGSASVSGGSVYVPCPEEIRAVSVTANGITDLWHAAVRNASSPVVGGGAVWVVDFMDGVLYELGQGDGHVLGQVSVGTATRFTDPTLSGGRAYIGTADSVVAVSGV